MEDAMNNTIQGTWIMIIEIRKRLLVSVFKTSDECRFFYMVYVGVDTVIK
jgi:hypothetical protein